jgi:hypothetical protein
LCWDDYKSCNSRINLAINYSRPMALVIVRVITTLGYLEILMLRAVKPGSSTGFSVAILRSHMLIHYYDY